MKRKPKIRCLHCGADLTKRVGRPPIGAKAMTSTERARRTRAKAKRDGTVQFEG